MALQPWEVLSSEVVYEAERWFRVRKERVRPQGADAAHDFYMIDKGDFAVACALTDRGDVVLTRQYRHGAGRETLDLPSGYVEPGEPAEEAMRRELLEETGYEAAAWRPLGMFTVDANRGGGRAHFFLATSARRVAEPRMDGVLEEIDIEVVPFEDALAAVRAGRFATIAPATCLALAALAR